MSEQKTFGLKPVELNMIALMQQRHNAEISTFLTYIASERLAYQATERTQFAINEGKLVITELEPETKEEDKKDGEESVATA